MPSRRELIPSKERDQYVADRRASGKREITVRCSERYIDEFLRFCDERFGTTSPGQLTAKQLEEYAQELAKKRILKNTLRTQLNELLKWFVWLTDAGAIADNPMKSLKASNLVAAK